MSRPISSSAAEKEMAQDPLIAALEEDARNQASRIIEEAQEAREAILRQARGDAQREGEERLSEAKERLRKTRAARINTARTKTAGMKLGVRQELITRAIDEARKSFFSLKGADYSKLLSHLYGELERDWARARLDEAPVVRVNPADVGIIRADGAAVKPDESIAAGVVFESADGRVRFENTVSSRIERAKKNMIPAINEMLFDEVLS